MTIDRAEILSLPIYRKRRDILKALQRSSVLVVESPTGSGKTTLLPYILYQEGYAKDAIIGVTQPRRIAAVSVASFIDTLVGASDRTVAYKMRFEDTTDESTRIKIMTDGTLLQEVKSDQLLSKYSVLIVDEAHERSVNIDFILGLLKRALQEREDIKVIISSATINTLTFSRYFNKCPVISIAAKRYPVDIRWSPAPPDLEQNIALHAAECFDAHYQEHHAAERTERRRITRRPLRTKSAHGPATLIFLSGEKAINDCIKALKRLPYAHQLFVVPLFGRLGKDEQDKAFQRVPPDITKVIVSTNIAETSVTIQDVTVVIDSGMAKINSYSTRSFAAILEEVAISRSSADQRTGRAGRTQPGVCYRLYTKHQYATRSEFTPEEILRSDLSEIVLRMAELGITDFLSFDFLSSPGHAQIQAAVKALERLGAIDRSHSLTTIGTTMTRFPLLPRHSRILIEAMNRYQTVLKECLGIVAFLTTPSPFIYEGGDETEVRRARARFNSPHGDFIAYYRFLQYFESVADREAFCREYFLDLRIMNEILNVSTQLTEIVESMGVSAGGEGPIEHLFAALASGLIDYVCARQSAYSYRGIAVSSVYIHPGSFLFKNNPEFIIAGEIVKTAKTFARTVSPLRREWLKFLPSTYVDKLLSYARAARRSGHRGRGRRGEAERDTPTTVHRSGSRRTAASRRNASRARTFRSRRRPG